MYTGHCAVTSVELYQYLCGFTGIQRQSEIMLSMVFGAKGIASDEFFLKNGRPENNTKKNI